ncbi:hypothetical protein [Eggerthia catenaformis]|uniref:oxidoreductase n=1 Tax=Eggerthia catenaformis TaxID=31973 RepID=UPI00248EA0E3|nr:hypothetical protein [Eggerthia catenaformis]
MSYEKLFEPMKIGKMEVKNRLVMSPMGTNSAFTNGRKDGQEIYLSRIQLKKDIMLLAV